jgi:hypothetical protein
LRLRREGNQLHACIGVELGADQVEDALDLVV